MISKDSKDNSKEVVKAWQLFLNSEQGESLGVDGFFGLATHNATIRFQTDNNLKPDGIVGLSTYNKAKDLGYSFSSDETKNLMNTAQVNDSLRVPKKFEHEIEAVILVSAGHSNVVPRDPGAVGNGFTEAVETLKVRDEVAKNLRELGCKNVIEDGSDGVNDPLLKAIWLARKAKVAVEFHFNAGPPKATGIEVLCKSDKKQLAQKIALSIRDATGLSLRGTEWGWKSDSSGQHHRLGFCQAGGLIVEVCFISNAYDMSKYTGNFKRMCANIAESIVHFLQ